MDNSKVKYKKEICKIIGALLFILTPLFSAILFCAKDGKTISDIYIALGGWSDEITYYKQIEGILSHGIPRGYFGFNQSQATYGSFAYWGVLPLIPYVLWGFFFGWTYLSPIYANIFLCILAFATIYVFIKPNKKWCLSFSLFWVVFQFLNRHILSAVVEASVIQQLVLVVVFGVCLLSDKVQERTKMTSRKENVILVICTMFIFYMTVVRPYYAVYYLIPFWTVIKGRKKGGIIAVPVITTLSILCFYLYKKFFCAAYFADVILTDVVLEGGLSGIFSHLVADTIEIGKYIWYAVRYHDTVGWYYLLLFVELAAMFFVCLYNIYKKKQVPKMYVVSLVGNTLILLSIMLLYNLTVGARHILALIVVNAVLLIVESHANFGVLLGTIAIVCTLLAGEKEPLPYKDPEYAAWMEQLEILFDENIEVTDDMSYDNVVAMPTSDVSVMNNQSKVGTYYGLLYAMPSGMGISIDEERIYDEPENIKAKYILVHPDGGIALKLEEMGMECIIEQSDFAIYSKK